MLGVALDGQSGAMGDYRLAALQKTVPDDWFQPTINGEGADYSSEATHAHSLGRITGSPRRNSNHAFLVEDINYHMSNWPETQMKDIDRPVLTSKVQPWPTALQAIGIMRMEIILMAHFLLFPTPARRDQHRRWRPPKEVELTTIAISIFSTSQIVDSIFTSFTSRFRQIARFTAACKWGRF